MIAQEIQKLLEEKFPGAILDGNMEVKQPFLVIEKSLLKPVCQFLKTDARLYFDYLACLSGVDYGEKEGKIGVVYHLYSLIHEHGLVLKCQVSRDNPDEKIPSLSDIWRAADWHEREAYDMTGIHFDGHPDLRRILLPEDWEGHPLRKDYEEAESYHGIKIKY